MSSYTGRGGQWSESPMYNSSSRAPGRSKPYGNPSYNSKPLPPYRRSNPNQQPPYKSSGNRYYTEDLPYDDSDYHSSGNSQSYHNNDRHTDHHTHDNYYSSPPRKPILFKPKKNTWIFSAEELAYKTPSIMDGMTHGEELFNRSKGVKFIIQVASLLKLPQMVVYAASTFFHRFYLRYSMKRFHHYVSV